MTDIDYMTRALELAERGRGYVEPNPLVGAVVARDGAIVGEGWHERYGQAHAEVNALAAAGHVSGGATLYVTLEPCCHYGKTPPCTDAVIRSGIRRVVAGMLDPFPEVAGKGVALLRAAGIEVETGICKSEARRLNAPYLKLLTTGQPYVHAKWAMSLDGKIATRTGHSRWITGEPARQRVHALRGRMDAIIVGRGTAVADDPMLTARPPGPRIPVRIILVGKGDLPESLKLLQTIVQAPVLLAATGEACARLARFRALGCEVVPVNASADANVSIADLLTELGRRRMTNVLVEGGAGVLGSFLDARAIDEVHAFVAPTLLGGAAALTSIGGRGVGQVDDGLRLTDWQIEHLGDDLLIHGVVGGLPLE